MRRSAKRSALVAAGVSPTLALSISKAYRNARFLATTLDEASFEDFLQDPETIAKYGECLNYWSCHKGDSYRGLEDIAASFIHRRERVELAKESRKMVVAMTKGARREGDVDAVAREYALMTRASILMARMLANSDRVAAEEIDAPEEKVSMMQECRRCSLRRIEV